MRPASQTLPLSLTYPLSSLSTAWSMDVYSTMCIFRLRNATAAEQAALYDYDCGELWRGIEYRHMLTHVLMINKQPGRQARGRKDETADDLKYIVSNFSLFLSASSETSFTPSPLTF